MKQDHKDNESSPEPDTLLERIEANTDPSRVSQAVIAKILIKMREKKN